MPYTIDRPPTAPAALSRHARRVSPTVLLLGTTSLLTDVSSEMVVAVLPLYATVTLGLSALQLGLLDGIYQGATALVRLAGGALADRHRRHKELATAGYAASAATRVGLLALPTFGWTGVMLFVDRLGKGLRSSPRDAMIALSSPLHRRAEAFGVHRTMDAAGAMAGPLAAFWILSLTPERFDVVFVVSAAVGALGVAVIGLFVRNPDPDEEVEEVEASAPAAPPPEPEGTADDRGPGPVTAVRSWLAGTLPGGAVRLARVAGLLGLVTVSDTFVYLHLADTASLPIRWFPLLFVGTAIAAVGLATPVGRAADRIGRGRVLVAGYAVFAATIALLTTSRLSAGAAVAVLIGLGVFYACTDGVLVAITSTVAPEGRAATAIALVTTAVAVGRFGSSLGFGLLSTTIGSGGAMVAFLVGLAVAVPLAARSLRTLPEVW